MLQPLLPHRDPCSTTISRTVTRWAPLPSTHINTVPGKILQTARLRIIKSSYIFFAIYVVAWPNSKLLFVINRISNLNCLKIQTGDGESKIVLFYIFIGEAFCLIDNLISIVLENCNDSRLASLFHVSN